MKTIKLFIIAAAGVMALIACNRENSLQESKTITIQASIGAVSKVTTTGNTAKFDDGDKITLYAWTEDKTAVPAKRVVDGIGNTLYSTVWLPDQAMLWADMVTPHYFLGIYPTRTVTDFKADAFTIKPDDYQASDLLVATNTQGLKATDAAVDMVFDHVAAKLFVNLTFRNQWDTDPTVSSVTVTAKKSGTVDYLAKTITATANETAAPIELNKDKNEAWSGLQVPQNIRSITITIDGKNYNFTHTDDIPLEGGKFTTVNLIVGRDKIDLGNVSISNWKEGTTINGGEAQNDED